MYLKRILLPILVVLPLWCLNGYSLATETETTEVNQKDTEAEQQTEEQQYQAWAQELLNSLERQTGQIALPNGVANLVIPDDFYYLSPEDTEKVLVEVWGNPPQSQLLGMIFPAAMTPFDQEAWAVTISYEEDGYVSDADAADIDYNELLVQMQEDTAAASVERIKQGYQAIELVGWAAEPYYAVSPNKLHWAKEIKFDQQAVNTLNYNIRMLGRKGVLVLNFIATIDQKPLIETNLTQVLAMADFTQGQKYSDFDPDLDEVAAYGLGALVAGKVIAKTGLLAAALIFLKKFGVIILLAIGVFVQRLFKKKKSTS